MRWINQFALTLLTLLFTSCPQPKPPVTHSATGNQPSSAVQALSPQLEQVLSSYHLKNVSCCLAITSLAMRWSGSNWIKV